MNTSGFWAIICALAISVAHPFADSSADNSQTLLMQAYFDGQKLDLFVKGHFNSRDINVKVANKTAEVKRSGSFSEEGVTVRTTILMDVSTSMPESARSKVNEFIEYEIKNCAQNEEMKIVTFGDKITLLQDFTSDRYDLSNAVKGIDYVGTQSTIYDAVYNTIPTIQSENGKPCFYRTVVITDGVDYAVGGITKEELFMRLRYDTYPINVICVCPKKPENPNKDLSAISRISNGGYLDFYPESDIAKCASEMSVSDFFWIRSEVPADLLDGSTRQIDVSDGNSSLIFDMKVSTVNVPQEGISQGVQPESDAPENSDTMSESDEISNVQTNKNGFVLNTANTIIIVLAGVTVTTAVIVVLIVLKKKKHIPVMPVVYDMQSSDTNDINGATEFYDENANMAHYTVKLSAQNNPSESWTLAIVGDTLIGRADNCTVKLNDKSVSREQCKISIGGAGLVVMNLSASNVTKLNGIKLSGTSILHSGDIIKLGRVSLKVDYIQKIGEELSCCSDISDDLNNGNTESIF